MKIFGNSDHMVENSLGFTESSSFADWVLVGQHERDIGKRNRAARGWANTFFFRLASTLQPIYILLYILYILNIHLISVHPYVYA